MVSISSGVEREETEMEKGSVPLAGDCSPYHLMNFSYTTEDFDRLLKLTDYNIQNNRDLILQAFGAATERKKMASHQIHKQLLDTV